MGCDIHFIIEQKVDNEWLGVYATDKSRYSRDLLGRQRNYYFFDKLAGVRHNGGIMRQIALIANGLESELTEPLNTPKGLPNNISKLSRLCIDRIGSDGHSHSFCTAEEFCKLYNEDLQEGEKPSSNESILGIYFREYEEDLDAPIEDYRIIFYFDN